MSVYEYIHKILYNYVISYFIVLYIFIPATYTGGGNRCESTYSSLSLEGHQWVSILEF
jgi:hypothetical protein